MLSNQLIIPINRTIKKTSNNTISAHFRYDKNPKIIFNRILKCLEDKDEMDVLLKITNENNHSFWTRNTFYKEQGIVKVIVKNYTNYTVINKVNILYTNLISIENKSSKAFANTYLDGYLESENITLCKIISHFSQSA